jgi:hypothetical protein
VNRCRELFDGESLVGWHAVPRLPTAPYPGGPEPDTGSEDYRLAEANPAIWYVREGAIVGEQAQGCFGGYLVWVRASFPRWPGPLRPALIMPRSLVRSQLAPPPTGVTAHQRICVEEHLRGRRRAVAGDGRRRQLAPEA